MKIEFLIDYVLIAVLALMAIFQQGHTGLLTVFFLISAGFTGVTVIKTVFCCILISTNTFDNVLRDYYKEHGIINAKTMASESVRDDDVKSIRVHGLMSFLHILRVIVICGLTFYVSQLYNGHTANWIMGSYILRFFIELYFAQVSISFLNKTSEIIGTSITAQDFKEAVKTL